MKLSCTHLQVHVEAGERFLSYKKVEDDGSAAVVGSIHELRH